ncbi:MAG: hypothetical protein JHD15_07065 [Phenylobacterium sp.]|uniref:hypothetical protein n=1 Tax=Phenylobacterium sp. TaxID=1871053 RepID=UPI001A226B18|nr:hypothetical protein [Phenylobacterium sp.]MBJ7410113.1 hypothetical protein [Phenylobacterium sp.]
MAIVGAPGVWAVATRWLDDQKVGRKERVDLVKLAEEVSAKAIQRLQARVEALEAELTELRKEHAETVTAKDARIALLEQKLELKEGELRQVRSTAESYDRLLTEKGIDHIPMTATVWEAKEGRMLLASGPVPGAQQ